MNFPVVLTNIAARIKAEHKAATDLARSAVQRACSAGELLIEAKSHCPHGMWLPWLKANCPEISPRTAQAYMAVAQHCLNHPADTSTLHELTFRGALRQLASPKSATAAHLTPAPLELAQWSGDDRSWLPDGSEMLLAIIEEKTIQVQQSAASPGYFHIILLTNMDDPSKGHEVEGSPRPVKEGVVPGLIGRLCRRFAGIGPELIDWEVLHADPSYMDDMVAKLLPPWQPAELTVAVRA